MNDALKTRLHREAVRTMAVLRSRYRKVVPVPPREAPGCHGCGTIDDAKGPFALLILSRGDGSELAVVTVAALCAPCYDSDRTKELILDRTMETYRRAFA